MENHNIEESRNAERPPITVVNGEAKPPSGKKKRVLLSFAGIILLAGIGTTGYLYSQGKSDNKELNSQIADLSGQVESLKQEPQEKAQAAEPAKEMTETVYKADVGKFTLTLPSEYYIVEEIDGGYEGGPITKATIGFPTDENNVISTDIFKTIGIYARPSEQKNFKSDVENEVGKDAKKVKTVKIDGVDADLYDVPGLSDSRTLVFYKDKVFYSISSTIQDKNTDKLIDEIVKGFKFN